MSTNYFYNRKTDSKLLKISYNYKENNQLSKEVWLYNEMVGFSPRKSNGAVVEEIPLPMLIF